MKKSTERMMNKSQQLLARAFIDRKRTAQQAILQEKRQIIKEADVSAAYLYDYYVSICQIPSWDLTNDKMVAKQIGLSERKVADTRRKLVNLGWIRFDTHIHGGIKYGMWYIGKEVVQMKMNQDTTIEEYSEVGILTDEEYEKLSLMIDRTNIKEE